VELVAAYEPYARQISQEKRIESRTTFRVADVLEQPEAVAPANIVVLNRVVCCSADGVRLTGVAARLAERILILSFPRDRFLVRLVVFVLNGTLRFMGRSFRSFVYPKASLYAGAQAEGFVLAKTGRPPSGSSRHFAALRSQSMAAHIRRNGRADQWKYANRSSCYGLGGRSRRASCDLSIALAMRIKHRAFWERKAPQYVGHPSTSKQTLSGR
jgi:hypothetical protein